MRNLIVTQCLGAGQQRVAPASDAETAAAGPPLLPFALQPQAAHRYLITHAGRLACFGPSGVLAWEAALAGHAPSGWLDATYLQEAERLFLAHRDGTMVLVDVATLAAAAEEVAAALGGGEDDGEGPPPVLLEAEDAAPALEDVGSIDGGLEAVAWVPDQSQVALVGADGKLLTLTPSSWDVLAEAAGPPVEGGAATPVHAWWRPDGSHLAVSYVDPATRERCIRVYHSDLVSTSGAVGAGILAAEGPSAAGGRHDEGEDGAVPRAGGGPVRNEDGTAVTGLPPAGGAGAWSPDGSLFGVGQAVKPRSRVQVALFETNGQRHRELVLPYSVKAGATSGVVDAVVAWLAWSPEGDVLAAVVDVTTAGSASADGAAAPVASTARHLQLWHRDNYAWALKREAVFSYPAAAGASAPALVGVGWDPERALRLHVFLASSSSSSSSSSAHASNSIAAVAWDLDWVYSTALPPSPQLPPQHAGDWRVSPASALGLTGSIDAGGRVGLTPAATSLVPPPSAYTTLNIAGVQVQEVAFPPPLVDGAGGDAKPPLQVACLTACGKLVVTPLALCPPGALPPPQALARTNALAAAGAGATAAVAAAAAVGSGPGASPAMPNWTAGVPAPAAVVGASAEASGASLAAAAASSPLVLSTGAVSDVGAGWVLPDAGACHLDLSSLTVPIAAASPLGGVEAGPITALQPAPWGLRQLVWLASSASSAVFAVIAGSGEVDGASSQRDFLLLLRLSFGGGEAPALQQALALPLAPGLRLVRAVTPQAPADAGSLTPPPVAPLVLHTSDGGVWILDSAAVLGCDPLDEGSLSGAGSLLFTLPEPASTLLALPVGGEAAFVTVARGMRSGRVFVDGRLLCPAAGAAGLAWHPAHASLLHTTVGPTPALVFTHVSELAAFSSGGAAPAGVAASGPLPSAGGGVPASSSFDPVLRFVERGARIVCVTGYARAEDGALSVPTLAALASAPGSSQPSSSGGAGAGRGDGVVLQMPRGNLEAVVPRALTLSTLRGLLDARPAPQWAPALELSRTHRVDMNLLVDHAPAALARVDWVTAAVAAVARGVGASSSSIGSAGLRRKVAAGCGSDRWDLLLSALDAGDVTASRYPLPRHYAPAPVEAAAPASAGLSAAEAEALALADPSLPLLLGPSLATVGGAAEGDKITRVCAQLRLGLLRAMAVHGADGSVRIAWRHPLVFSVVTSFARQNPADLESVLRVIQAVAAEEVAAASGPSSDETAPPSPSASVVPAPGPITAEAAMSHGILVCDADVELLWSTALGTYSIHLAHTLAQRGQQDPREYRPFLASLARLGKPQGEGPAAEARDAVTLALPLARRGPDGTLALPPTSPWALDLTQRGAAASLRPGALRQRFAIDVHLGRWGRAAGWALALAAAAPPPASPAAALPDAALAAASRVLLRCPATGPHGTDAPSLVTFGLQHPLLTALALLYTHGHWGNAATTLAALAADAPDSAAALGVQVAGGFAALTRAVTLGKVWHAALSGADGSAKPAQGLLVDAPAEAASRGLGGLAALQRIAEAVAAHAAGTAAAPGAATSGEEAPASSTPAAADPRLAALLAKVRRPAGAPGASSDGASSAGPLTTITGLRNPCLQCPFTAPAALATATAFPGAGLEDWASALAPPFLADTALMRGSTGSAGAALLARIGAAPLAAVRGAIDACLRAARPAALDEAALLAVARGALPDAAEVSSPAAVASSGTLMEQGLALASLPASLFRRKKWPPVASLCASAAVTDADDGTETVAPITVLPPVPTLQSLAGAAARLARTCGSKRLSGLLLCEHGVDPEEGVTALCATRGWVLAANKAVQAGRPDLLDTVVLPDLDASAEIAVETCTARVEELAGLLKRLAACRAARAAAPLTTLVTSLDTKVLSQAAAALAWEAGLAGGEEGAGGGVDFDARDGAGSVWSDASSVVSGAGSEFGGGLGGLWGTAGGGDAASVASGRSGRMSVASRASTVSIAPTDSGRFSHLATITLPQQMVNTKQTLRLGGEGGAAASVVSGRGSSHLTPEAWAQSEEATARAAAARVDRRKDAVAARAAYAAAEMSEKEATRARRKAGKGRHRPGSREEEAALEAELLAAAPLASNAWVVDLAELVPAAVALGRTDAADRVTAAFVAVREALVAGLASLPPRRDVEAEIFARASALAASLGQSLAAPPAASKAGGLGPDPRTLLSSSSTTTPRSDAEGNPILALALAAPAP